MEMRLKSIVFWDMMLCDLVEADVSSLCITFYWLHAVHLSKTLVNFYHSVLLHISEGSAFHCHHSEIIKYNEEMRLMMKLRELLFFSSEAVVIRSAGQNA
jgi:hypothetical protein